MTTITCRHCGELFEHSGIGGRGHTPAYCSDPCRAAARQERMRSTGQCTIDGCSKRARPSKDQVCEMHYYRKRRTGTYDDPPMQMQVRRNSAGYVLVRRDGHPLARTGGSQRGFVYEQRLVLFDASDGQDQECHWCQCLLSWSLPRRHPNALLVHHRNGQVDDNRPENLVACCRACLSEKLARLRASDYCAAGIHRWEERRSRKFNCNACRRARRRRERCTRKLAEAAQGTVGHRVWIQVPCLVCARKSWLNAKDQHRPCCSAQCTKINKRRRVSDAEQRRRATQRAQFVANVNRLKVFEADGWKCHLCGKAVDRTAQVPHPKAPTVDHVIPLAKGGTHEPANCRTAHFLCNSLKGDRGGGQLVLTA